MALHSLNGVLIGSPLAGVQTFGPAEGLAGKRSDPDLLYFSLALEIEFYEQRVVSFRIITDPHSREILWHRKFKPGVLWVQFRDGSAHALSRETGEKELIALFGAPIETGPIGNDRMHTFEVEGNIVETYHEPGSGRLVELEILLAGSTEERAIGASPI